MTHIKRSYLLSSDFHHPPTSPPYACSYHSIKQILCTDANLFFPHLFRNIRCRIHPLIIKHFLSEAFLSEMTGMLHLFVDHQHGKRPACPCVYLLHQQTVFPPTRWNLFWRRKPYKNMSLNLHLSQPEQSLGRSITTTKPKKKKKNQWSLEAIPTCW